MAQLELPIDFPGGLNQADPQQLTLGKARLPEAAAWIESTSILPGHAFAIWGAPAQWDNLEETKNVLEGVFQTCVELRKSYPWSIFQYKCDLPTHNLLVTGMAYHSAQEMAAAVVMPTLVNSIARFVSTAVASAGWATSIASHTMVSQTSQNDTSENASLGR